MKILKVVINVLTFIFFVTTASAQVVPGSSAPELKTKQAVDSYGIDLISGQALISGG